MLNLCALSTMAVTTQPVLKESAESFLVQNEAFDVSSSI
jgi:hypothetical protein